MTVHLYVDVDGVLNALAPTSDSGWDHFERTVVRGYVISWSPDLVARLNAIAARDDTAMHWLTTWGADAPRMIGPALGLDGRDWSVLGPAQHHIGGRTWNAGRAASASERVETSVPIWWKLEAIQQHLPAGVRAVWLDDDLRYDEDALAWVKTRGDLLGVAPALETGISRVELEQVEKFLAAVA